MENNESIVQITEFCKKVGRNYDLWLGAIGADLTDSNGRKTLLNVSRSSSGEVASVSVGLKNKSEEFSVNNLQTRFRSIVISRDLYLRLFQPEKYEEIIKGEEKKWKLEEAKIKETERLRKKEEVPLRKLDEHLNRNFLSSASYYKKYLSDELSLKSYESYKANFVKTWIEQNTNGQVDIQQAHAISSAEDHTIVTARAGSGKTATLVNRIVFLNKHCGVNPEDFLVLAFNTNAATEIKTRLKIATGKDFNSVMTFHSLAYSIVHPTEAILYDNPKAQEFNQSKVIQDLIDFHLKDQKWNERIKAVMLSYFKQDWDEIAAKGFNLSTAEMVEFRKNSPKIGLDGWYYKSYGEKKIADILFEYGLHYEYERNFWWNSVNYKPDFTLKQNKKQVVIEYFGLEGQPEYDQQTKEKRDFWARDPDWTLLEVYPDHISGVDLETFIISSLGREGILTKKLLDDEIWEKIQHRAVDQFSKMSSDFIGRVRQNSYTPDNLKNLIQEHETAFPHEDDFLSVMSSIFSGYVQRIEDTGEDDFSGLMMHAIEKMESGVSEFQKRNYVGNLKSLKFIMVDEFQDFTDLFYKCITSIQRFNKNVNLFCVGDDWQAINGFAGSDLRYFLKFTDQFGKNKALKIQTNYRSTAKIVNAGNQLMVGQGAPAQEHTEDPGTIELVDLSNFEPSDGELHTFENQIFVPAILRIICKLIKNEKTVTLLTRNNSIPWYIGRANKDLDGLSLYLKNFLPDDELQKIKYSTIHGFKGQQSDAVILIDFKRQRYPFVHPNNFFTRIFGDTVSSILMDERRLLYVGLTRAKKQLFLVTDKKDIPAEFRKFSEISSHIKWEKYPPVLIGEDGSDIKIVSIVGKTFPLKGMLMSAGYRWTPRKQKNSGSWSKRINFSEIDSIDHFNRTSWIQHADDIQILIYSERGMLETELKVWNGIVSR